MSLAAEIAVFIRAEGFRFDEGMLTATPSLKSYSRGDYSMVVGSITDWEVLICIHNMHLSIIHSRFKKFHTLANFKSFFVRDSGLYVIEDICG